MEELEYYREVRNDVYQEMDSQKDTPHPMFALRVSLALATIEAELYLTLNDGVNYMFYHTYENVDRIIVGVHVETQEELDEMKRDRDFVLNSGKLDYEDAFRDE